MLLTEYHLEFLSLKGGCTGSSVSTLVKRPHCLKSHVATQIIFSDKKKKKKKAAGTITEEDNAEKVNLNSHLP